MEEGEAAQGVDGDIYKGEIVQDITTSFVVLCAIYFPSVTGKIPLKSLNIPQKSRISYYFPLRFFTQSYGV